MKKISYILGILGVILILIAIFLPNKNNNDNNLGWNIEYKKDEITNQNFPEYNYNSYKKININQNNNYYYIIPQDAYLSSMTNDIVEYRNNEILIIRYNYYLDNDKIINLINSYKNSDISVEILKKELPNGNIYLLEKTYDGNYHETLNIFIKIDNVYYYHLYYRVNNMRFSNEFINEITDMSKYQETGSNYSNVEGMWQVSINAVNKKTFSLIYDSSKYYKGELSQDYGMLFKINNNFEKIVQLSLIYNKEDIDEENDLYTISSSEKRKLKGYDCIINTIVYHESNDEFIHYIIILDNNTKLMISYNKKIEHEVDISDFLNFTYE